MKNTKNNVLLISQYLDILGGGEQHIFSILKVFDECGYASDIVWKDNDILEKLHKIHNISFDNARIISSVPQKNLYKYCLYVTDGSYFSAESEHTFIFFMYPKKELMPRGIINAFKTRKAQFFANGEFTAEKMRVLLNKHVEVVHPYIDEVYFQPEKKKNNIILSVGRFFPHLHSKRQDILIQAFKELQKKYPTFRSYSLVLAGGLTDAKEDRAYLDKLLEMKGENNNIDIRTNLPQKEILELYASAKIYWHAAGFGIDEDEHPDAVEHLGITPLQGMAASAVTICHNSGGPRRYIRNGETGYIYDTVRDLITLTSQLTDKSMQVIGLQGSTYVRENFSKKVFEKKVKDYFHL